MAGITLTQAQAMLDAAIEAQTKAMAKGQAYGINSGGAGRNMQRANLADLQAAVVYWDQQVKILSARALCRTRAYSVVSA